MDTLINGLRTIVGVPAFYDVTTGVVNYNLMLEYVFACFITIVTVASVFRLIVGWFK